jgi:hypothetical protein
LTCQINLDTEEKYALRFLLERGLGALPVELFCNHFGIALLSAILAISFAWNETRTKGA